MSLFGTSQPQQPFSSFGASLNNLSTTNPAFRATTQSNQNQQSQQQQQQQQQSNAGSSVFGASLLNNNGNASQQAQMLQQSQLSARLAETIRPRERSIPEQMELLLRRWSPESPACVMQSYFYNSVPPGTAPFWSPGPEEDEAKWEEALAKKPDENSVPVFARGFQQLGIRLTMQVQAIQQLQQRLHEMNNSLDAMMQNHELQLSVRANEARRKHISLSQKCLTLAIKVQMLRSRGFVMDAAEEELRRKLEGLERSVFDPSFSGREEEIWARMVALRERTTWLTRESEKLGRHVQGGSDSGLSDDVLLKVKKILSDYDVQIAHLKKELESVIKEYEDWQSGNKQS